MRKNQITYQKSLNYRESRLAWLFSAPALLLLLVFLIIPFFMAFGLSFTDQRLIPNPRLPTEFVGFRNYLRLLGDDTFLTAVKNCFLFVGIVVPVQTSMALGLAILVNQRLKGVTLFRTIYFSPVVITMVVVSVIWTFLYDPGDGFINYLIGWLSFGLIGPQDWLNNPSLAFFSIMLLSIWQGVGFQMVIFLAGLQSIPRELYQAAEVDGVNSWQKFIHVTLPQLHTPLVFVIISTTILAFKLFVQVWVMQGPAGHPQESTITLMVYAVSTGFRMGKIGYASAITVLFFLIVLGFSILQQYLLREDQTVE